MECVEAGAAGVAARASKLAALPHRIQRPCARQTAVSLRGGLSSFCVASLQGGPGELPLVIQRELPPAQAGDPDRLVPLIAEALRGGGGSVLVFCASRRQCQVCRCASHTRTPAHQG